MASNEFKTNLFEQWRCWIAGEYRQHYSYRQFYMVLVASLVGVVGGAGTIILHEAITWSTEFFFETLQPALASWGLGRYALVLLPMVGGLVVGAWLQWWGNSPIPAGVSGIMERVALFGGHMPPIPFLTRIAGSVITLGSGGSAGPEDPSVQVGSLAGSTIAHWLRLSDERTRTLVGCGAAAGIASAFNAPLAGSFFAMEIVLGQFQGMAFSMIVISAIVSAVVTQMALGRGAAFPVPAYTFVSFQELLLYALLGILAALAALFYVQSQFRIGDRLRAWKISPPLKAGFGGLLVGITGLWLPQIMGLGYEPMGAVLEGQQFSLGLLAALVLVKAVATSVTLGSGGIGGVFAPSLFIGAMLGSLVGQIAHSLFPATTAAPTAYAMVGMAALLAGAVRSPLTAIMLLFEMTGDLHILLPLTIAVVVSTTVADALGHESVYTWSLLRRGIRLEQGHDIDVMQGVLVGEIMDTDQETVPETLPLGELQQAFINGRYRGFPVLNADHRLTGVVAIHDLVRARQEPGWEQRTVGQIATHRVEVVYPDEPVWVALKRMSIRDLGRLPVVDRQDPTRFLGIIRRDNIIKAYSLAMLRRTEVQERAEQFRLSRLTGRELLEMTVVPGAFADGKQVKQLPLPAGCLLTAKRVAGKARLLHGDDLFMAGERVMALANTGEVMLLRRLFEMSREQAGISETGEWLPMPPPSPPPARPNIFRRLFSRKGDS